MRGGGPGGARGEAIAVALRCHDLRSPNWSSRWVWRGKWKRAAFRTFELKPRGGGHERSRESVMTKHKPQRGGELFGKQFGLCEVDSALLLVLFLSYEDLKCVRVGNEP